MYEYMYVCLHADSCACMYGYTCVHACVYNCADIRACKVAQVAQGGSSSGGFRGAQRAPESKEIAQQEIYGEPKGAQQKMKNNCQICSG